ncbi:histidine--tRNA ligase [Methanobacterium alcaliphilum]|uniref:histidine--tRNA ligase n=1 Tax=Methanobacterium alcaliphilum TaxID=392018 RepID=UPI00200B77AD|nr:histidine--tRNA ligase [Methanobacterium alcaliphilum]MCK9151741.1 histidine--tRNA ligase [Methanobacterium alcaliphilum]
MELTRPRGTRDFLFEEMKQRKQVESTLKRIFEIYAYQEIKTPIFENLSLFTTKSGEEIVDQLYNFKDKGERDLALRPELTAPVARLYMNEMQKNAKPIKMYYYGSCFRYERPQKGRFRQFWQFGCEMIGGKFPEADAEVITMAHHALNELGLEGFEIHIGHLGLLRGLLKEAEVDESTQDHIMGLIDKGNVEELEIYLNNTQIDNATKNILLMVIEMKGNSNILDAVKEEIQGHELALKALHEFSDLLETLDDFGMDNYIVNLGIARGLDYYSGMVFEIYVPKLGAQKQICGGGTYNLVETFGGEKIESTGFAFGFDRLMNALLHENTDLGISTSSEVFVAPISNSTRGKSFEIAQNLRNAGISTEVDLARKKLKKILTYADNLGVKKVILIGEKDLLEGKLTVKDMKSRDQELISIEDVVNYIKNSLT